MIYVLRAAKGVNRLGLGVGHMENEREKVVGQTPKKADAARMYPENQLGEQKKKFADTFSAFTAVKRHLGIA